MKLVVVGRRSWGGKEDVRYEKDNVGSRGGGDGASFRPARPRPGGAGHLRLVLGLQLRQVRRVGVLVLEPHLGVVVLDGRKEQDNERIGTDVNARAT